MISRKNTSTQIQLLYYGIIGLLTNALGYFLFVLLTYVGVGAKISVTCLYLLCALLSFLSNWRITFNQFGAFLVTGVRFIAAHLVGYLINFIILLVFVDGLNYPAYKIEAFAIIMVAGYMFIAFKFFVFSNYYRTMNEKMSRM
ncbi:GtrA family protein [Legionella sp.]|uniref:GtrA family protein n=1 Tax=Legionella sp. TaxID=459 RepID=UPI003CA9C8F9